MKSNENHAMWQHRGAGREIAAELTELLRAVDRPMCPLHLPQNPAAM